jgi:tetratricopeptide (TPR) repeat protein
MNLDLIIRQARELGRKNWVHAMHILNSAVDQYPDDPALQSTMGEMYISRMQYSSALKHYLRALAFEPDNPDIIRNIAGCYLAKRDYQLALVYYQRITNPTEDVLYNIGYTQAILGKNRDCIETMLRLVQRLPDHPYIYYLLIEQHIELGELDTALNYVKIAQRRTGDSMQLNLFAGLINSLKGNDMMSCYYYRLAAAMGEINNPDHMIRFASAALKTGLPHQALRILMQCESQWPYLGEIYVNLIKVYLFLNMKDEAKKVMLRAQKNLAHLSPALRILQERLKG